MSYHLILPFFPEELRELLLDPSISDLMINGTTGVFADRNGVVQHIPLASPYSNDRLQAAIERVARILGQDLSSQNPILNTRLPDGSRVAVVGAPSSINGPTLTHDSQLTCGTAVSISSREDRFHSCGSRVRKRHRCRSLP
jgi:pilus assembly protein CpaF